MSKSSEFGIVPVRMSPNESVCNTVSELSHVINNVYVHVSGFRFASPWATNKTNIGVPRGGGDVFLHRQMPILFCCF
jgi:hypothetical protein